MEVVNNYTATVYYRDDIGRHDAATIMRRETKSVILEDLNIGDDDYDQGSLIKWKVEFRIKRFPKLLAKQTSVPFLFSPNFNF